jgi:5-methylcytosine-specific restriction endonuclease McrA
MKLSDYLRAKYPHGFSGMPASEAAILGIPMPLEKGWAQRHASMTLSQAQQEALLASLQKQLTKKNEKRKGYAELAIDFLQNAGEFKAEVEHLKRQKERKKSRERRSEDFLKEVAAPKPSPSSDEFLKSYEWRRVRMAVLKRDGAICACCGATRADGVSMHVDHIKPRRIFPALALDANNLQVLCEVCNHGKGNWDMTDWRGSAAKPDDDPADEFRQRFA